MTGIPVRLAILVEALEERIKNLLAEEPKSQHAKHLQAMLFCLKDAEIPMIMVDVDDFERLGLNDYPTS